MTMIGSYPGRQKCPECDGVWAQHRGEQAEYFPGWPNPANGKWGDVPVWVECDICGGSGKVTKKTIAWLLAAV